MAWIGGRTPLSIKPFLYYTHAARQLACPPVGETGDHMPIL